MLNLRKTIMFCVLFAAVWGQPPGDLSDEDKQLIDYFDFSFIRVMADKKRLIQKGGFDHFQSWENWDNLRDEDKLAIARIYKGMVEGEKLRLGAKQRDLIAILASKALDQHANWWIERLQKHPVNRHVNGKAMKKVVRNGEFLKSLAYEGGPEAYLMTMSVAGSKSKVFPGQSDQN